MPLRVKEKSTWKTVQIPEDVLNTDNFDLVDIQELTDYELVPYDADSSERENDKKSKQRSKKRKENKEIQNVEKEHTVVNTEGKSKPRKRNRKRKGIGKGEDEQIIEVLDSGGKTRPDAEANDINDEDLHFQKTVANKNGPSLPKKRKLAQRMLSVKAVDVVTGEECMQQSDDISKIVDAEEKVVTKKSKKRKKKSQKVSKQEENENSQLLVNKKSKKKKKKPQENQKQSDELVPGEVDDSDSTDVDMTEWKNLFLPDEVLKALQELRFSKPTLIQKMALPSAIRDRKDILGAAETGSGKTLAFGIPILSRILEARRSSDDPSDDEEKDDDDDDENNVDNLKQNNVQSKGRKKNPPFALILEPTRELAVQVRKHLVAVSKYTNIKFANVVGGMSVEKQRRVLSKSPEVIIATPGRLWQLIEEGNEHLCQVDCISCLAVDEADRMVEKGHYEELTKLLELINKSPRKPKNRQTFIMSATLTMDVSAPKRLLNKKKKIPKEEDKIKTLIDKISVSGKPHVIDLTPDDKVAQTLTELRVNCKANDKDFYLYYILAQHPGRTLVFVNSKDCLRRLITVFSLLECSPLPLHADMHQRQRLKNLDKFSEKKKGLLVASDVAARGLDIPGVDHVIHYQVPRTMENYVHRSGRTARASNFGLSVMFVGPEDAKDYRKIIFGVRNGEDLPMLPVELDLMPAVKQRVMLARELDVKEYRIKKKRIKNNFFIKAAEEMDMIIDDDRLLEDMGDISEQAQEKQELAGLKTTLSRMLQGGLAPLRMSKYPTKSGGLAVHAKVDLLVKR